MNKTTIYHKQTRMLMLIMLLLMSVNAAWAQIPSLPYSADFSDAAHNPFSGGELTSTANIGRVLAVNNTTATATFTGGYTLRNKETITLSFTAYHGWINRSTTSTIEVRNTSGESLVSYTYNHNSTNIADVSFGGTTVDGFAAFQCTSKFNATNNANGFVGGDNNRHYQSTAGYNPTITMTIRGDGFVAIHFECSAQRVDTVFYSYIDKAMNLGSMVITDNVNNADRCIAIDNLDITTELYSCDYEHTGTYSDWVTANGGRYTPTILTEDNNLYLGVDQDSRYNNGTILTNNAIGGCVEAGENYTLEFDLKLGRSNRDQKPTKFVVYASDGTTELFSMEDEGTLGTNTWTLKVAGNDSENITLEGDGTGGYSAITWHHYKLSYTNGRLYVTIDSKTGVHKIRKGFPVSVSGIGKMTFDTKRYSANFAIDNLVVSRYAETNYTLSGKNETYTISSEGDLPQVDEGQTVSIDYGVYAEVQMTKTKNGTIAVYCVDTNTSGTYSRAWAADSPTETNLPVVGTYYKITPKFDGKLSISGWVDGDVDQNVVNNVTLQNREGTVVATYLPSNSDYFADHLFDVELTADQTYYLYASTPNTANNSSGNYATLFLSSFKFEQTSMNREVKVSNLLYTNGKKQTDGLDRTIPGMTLTFTGGNAVEVVESGAQLKLSSASGTMAISLRQNSHSATITSVTFQVANAASGTKITINGTEKSVSTGKKTYTLDSPSATATIVCTAGDFRFTSFSIGYNSGDTGSEAEWLDESKSTPSLSFTSNHIMRVPGDGQAFTNTPTYSSPSSFSGALTYSSSNNTIATINTNGTNGQLLRSGEATITATFAETDYFNGAAASYTVSNVLKNGESYTRTVTNNDNVRINAYASAANSTLTLTGTSDASMSIGTTTAKFITTANSTSVTMANNSGKDITFDAVAFYQKNPVAYLYYEGQEGNYKEQVHFVGFASGSVTGFRVLDIGDATDPIDITSAYSLKEGAYYVWTDGDRVTKESHLGSTFDQDKGSFTASDKSSGDETLLPRLTHLLTKTGTADGYDNEMTAIANLRILAPEDEDTYKTWDMTSSVTGWGQMDSRWSWNGHGYYQTYFSEYMPILNNTGETLAGNEGLLLMGDARYYTGTTGLRLNLTSVNGRLKFPVKAGMEVKIEMASSSADIEHIISNVTDLFGESVSTLYIEKQGTQNPVTAYYLAADDGAIEIRSMDKTGAYVKRVTLQKPRIHFTEEVVVVSKADAAYDITNIPYNTGDATLTYSISPGTSFNLDGTAAADNSIATVPTATEGKVNVKGVEGYVTVNVVNNAATGVTPKKGSYLLYVIDFKFAKDTYTSADESTLDLSSASNGESVFDILPTGNDKVVQPVTYSMEYVSGSPRGRLVQYTNENPKLTTYTLTAYSPGTIRITATTGRIETYTDVVISGGNHYAEVAPARRTGQLETEVVESVTQYYYRNQLPLGFDTGITYTCDRAGTVTCDAPTTVSETVDEVTTYYTKIPNISGYGAIRVKATTSDDKVATFILTVAYPASSGKKWNFYRMKNYTHDATTEYGLKIGYFAEYNGDASQSIDDKDITGKNGWTTADTKWNKVYRKGTEQPRWAYAYSTKSDNAFIIEETAGLQIESGQKGFYTDNPHQPSEYAYNHIGLRNNASVIIPRLRQGDYIRLNLSRVIPNSGAILTASNVTDLAGTKVDRAFTITRSQIDYSENGVPATDNKTGARIIPGYYTFRAAEDGDVTFTLSDEGCLDILSIEIYDGDYEPTMTSIKTDGLVAPPVYYLTDDDDESREFSLTNCHNMWSTSVGPAEYVVLSKTGNCDVTLENVEWVSPGGALYNLGKVTTNGNGSSYGQLQMRMNNYTAEGRYLIGYTPTYILTIGHKPHQDYPYTWNFENISGDAVKGRSNNAYNSISTDYLTWTNMGYETFALDNTQTGDGSMYVPGATLMSAARDLGAKGTISALNSSGLGCDELNGLGFNGKIIFKVAQQGSSEEEIPESLKVNSSLLAYTMTSDNYQDVARETVDGVTVSKKMDAGDGKIVFGSPDKRYLSNSTDGGNVVTTEGATYKMDGGNSKNMLLIPERPFKNGDVIHLKGYSTAKVLNSGYSFYAAQNDNAADALVTINWPTDETVERTLDYTVKRGDGLAGRSEVYLFRADKKYSVYLTSVSITPIDETKPTSYERALTCAEATTITIPDLTTGQYVYIKSSAEPTNIASVNLTAATSDDGQDAADGVYKYKVTANGSIDLSFADATTIYRIGVTNILKPVQRVGTGYAWATESRNHAIDYEQTGIFTVNDVMAKYVTAQNYTSQKATVTMNEITDYALPASTGLVLQLSLDKDDKVTNFKKAKQETEDVSYKLPLFYPPYSKPIASPSDVKFGGTLGNLMKANLEEQKFNSETETIDDVEYTRFILASRYMKWKKENSVLSHDGDFTEGTVPVFYRMHLYKDADVTGIDPVETTDALNTLGANKAYMLLRTSILPDALWNSSSQIRARKYISIEGVSDVEEIYDVPESAAEGAGITSSAIYNLSGQKVADDDSEPLMPGIYIRNGKKFIVR